jgi:hypothetical protein
MKRSKEKLLMCGAENIAALAIIGAMAQSLVELGPKYEAAIHKALDAAAAGLALVARSANSNAADYVEALRIVQRLRAFMPEAKAQWPAEGDTWGHA